MSGRAFPIGAGEHEAVISEVGAGLRGYRCAGRDVTVGYDADELPPKGCGTTLVPWPNRIRGGRYTFDGVAQQLPLGEPEAGNAIHGLGRWARWAPVEQAADSVTLRLDVVPQKGYPHEVEVTSTYRLDAERGLTVTLQARNTGASRAPFGAGNHPYLATCAHGLDDVVVQVPAAQRLVTDDAQIPVAAEAVDGTRFDLRDGAPLGERRFDEGFTGLTYADGRGSAVVATPSGGARLWFDDAFRYLQVFTVDQLLPGTAGVAIEPMTCAPDAFNSGDGLIVLEPRASWSASWGIEPLT